MNNTVYHFGRSPPTKRPYVNHPPDFPALGARGSAPRPPSIDPVIISLKDGPPNFKDMRIAERNAFHFALKSYAGEALNSNVMTGGDLCVYPSSKEQQKLLLDATIIADREISCTLPRSSSIFKGVIFGVPIAEKEEDILAALSDQNVTIVKRLPIKGRPEILSETILLTFSSNLPDKVKISAMAFRVHPSAPNPLSCKKCWLLGHTTSRCNGTQNCKKCGKSHPSDVSCITRCINCNSPAHEADYAECPEYIKAKSILKYASTHGITVQEARTQYNGLYSQAVVNAKRYPSRLASHQSGSTLPTTIPLPDAANSQIAALQSELKRVQEEILPKLNSSIAALTRELAETNEKVNNFDRRFDSIEKKQDKEAKSHSYRFDVLENLLTKLTEAIAPAIASSNPSPITGKDPTLLSAHSLSDRHEFSMSFTHPLGNELFSPDNHDFDSNVNQIDD
jgi:hypothetical protein